MATIRCLVSELFTSSDQVEGKSVLTETLTPIFFARLVSTSTISLTVATGACSLAIVLDQTSGFW